MSSAEQVHQTLVRLCDEFRGRGVARLPAERDLADRLGASRSTVRRVLNEMEKAGSIYRMRGRAGGAFLTGVPTDPITPGEVPDMGGPSRKVIRDLNHAVGLPKMLSDQGFNVGTQVIRAGLEAPAEAVRTFFGLVENQPVVSLLRVRYADGEALSLEHVFLPAHRLPGLLHHPLNQSIYELLAKEYDVQVARSSEAIEATVCPPSASDMLGISVDAPLLKVTRQSWDDTDLPIEYSVDLFRADRTRLTVHTDVASKKSRVVPLDQSSDFPQTIPQSVTTI